MIVKIWPRIQKIAKSNSLSARTAQSSVWIAAGFAVQRGLQFLSNLILTRLLYPEAFGIMSLATVFLVGLAMFSDIGIKPSIIRDPRSRELEFLNTAWTIQVIRGFGLFCAGCLLAYPVSIIYGEPILLPLLITISSTAAISGFHNIKFATAERDLQFFMPNLVTILGQIIGVVALVALSWAWQSVWALVAGNIITSIATVALGHCFMRGHRHQFRFDNESAQSIVKFGRWIMLSTIVTFVGGEGLRALQAGMLTLAEFGILSIANTIATIATDLPAKITSGIGMPAIAEAHRSSPARMIQVLTQMRRRVLITTIPLAIISALVSGPLIDLLYDDRYRDAARFAPLLILSYTIAVFFSIYCTTLLVIGTSKLYLAVMSFIAISRIAGIILGFKFFDISGMIIGIGISNLITLILLGISPFFRKYNFVLSDLVAVMMMVSPIAAFIILYPGF